MTEHEQLTGYSGSGYTGGMSEGGVEANEQEKNGVLETAEGKNLEEKIRKLETKLQGQKETAQAEQESRDVLRELKDWSEWGWERGDKERVRQGLLELFGWQNRVKKLEDEEKEKKRKKSTEEKKALANVENAMEILLGQGKTGAEVLQNLEDLKTNRELNRSLDEEAEKLAGRDPNIDKWKHLYKLKYLAKSDRPSVTVTADGEQERPYTLGIEDDQVIQRFVLAQEFERENKEDYDRNTPKGLEELAWQIAFQKDTEFGVNGRYPILQMEIKHGANGKPEGSYRVNQANFMRWMRQIIMFYHDKDPDGLTNYFNAVKIPKEYRPVTLDDITDEKERFFTDKEGVVHDDLYNQMLKEVLTLLYLRGYDLEYQQVMSSGENLTKKLGELYYKNKITKNSFGKSMSYHMSVIPLDYKGSKSDDKLGAAFSTMHLAYYNLADFEKLKEVLGGEDSAFFRQETWYKAIQKIIEGKHGMTGHTREDLMRFLGEKGAENFKKAFKTKTDENGKEIRVADGKNFTSFINYFGAMAYSGNTEKMVAEALKLAIRERYNFTSSELNINALEDSVDKDGKPIIDEASLDMAWLIALSWQRFSGAATRNDTGFSAYDSTKKKTGLEGYRRKMATEKRGNAFGNPYTVSMFKKVMLDFMQAIRVSEAFTEVRDTKANGGDPLPNAKGDVKLRKKALVEVFEDMNQEKLDQAKKRRELEEELVAAKNDPEKQRNIKDIQAQLDESYRNSRKVAGQLEFNERAMINYVANHVSRAEKVYDQVMGAKEITFDKFSKYDPITRKMSFSRADFQKEIQEDFLKPVRYLFDTFGEVNYNMPVREQVFLGRDKDGTDRYEFREIMLGEAIFGHQVLDIPEFRKCYKQLKTVDGKEKLVDIPGKYVIDEDGRYVIDYTKVQENQTLAYKQWALMKLGADLWTHIDSHSTDPTYTVHYFQTVLEAIESIPGEIVANEFNMRDATVTEKFFSHEQIAWLRKLSTTTDFRMFLRGLWQDFRHYDKEGSPVAESISIILGAVVRGY